MHTLPKYQTHETHGDSKVLFLQRQYGFRKTTANTIPRTSDDTRCLSQLSHNSISSPYSLRDLQHKSKPNIPCCKQKTIPKNSFRLSASYFHALPLLPYKHSEETTQCKHTHTYVTPSSSLNTNKYYPFPAPPQKKQSFPSLKIITKPPAKWPPTDVVTNKYCPRTLAKIVPS